MDLRDRLAAAQGQRAASSIERLREFARAEAMQGESSVTPEEVIRLLDNADRNVDWLESLIAAEREVVAVQAQLDALPAEDGVRAEVDSLNKTIAAANDKLREADRKYRDATAEPKSRLAELEKVTTRRRVIVADLARLEGVVARLASPPGPVAPRKTMKLPEPYQPAGGVVNPLRIPGRVTS